MIEQVLLKFEKKMEDSGPLRAIGKIPQVLLDTGVDHSLEICGFSHESVPLQRLPQLGQAHVAPGASCSKQPSLRQRAALREIGSSSALARSFPDSPAR